MQNTNAKRKTHGTAVRFSMSFPLFFRALHLMLASSSGVSKCFLVFQGSRKNRVASFAGRGAAGVSGHAANEARRRPNRLAATRWALCHLRTWKRHIIRAVSGLPRRCEADAWEEETQAERSSREERSGGPKGFAATRARGLPREKSCREFIGRLRPSVFSCFWMKKWAETG